MTDAPSVIEVLECAHLRPGDRLILRVHDDFTIEQTNVMREQIELAGFTPQQVALVSGVEEMLVVEAAAGVSVLSQDAPKESDE